MSEKKEILQKALGPHWDNGSELLFYCPKCRHHKKKLSINIEKDVFKCWICDYSGNNIAYLIKDSKPEYIGAWMSMSRSVDITKYDTLFQPEMEIEEAILDLPEGFKSLSGPPNSLKRRPLQYLYSRGITDIDITRWKLGFCDFGTYENRIIIPSFNEEGNLNYFVARTYVDHYIKYKNPKTSKDIIFNEINIDWESDIILTEGPFDSIKNENCIPMLGSTLTERSKLFQKICHKKNKVYLALDEDAKDKTFSIVEKFTEYGLDVYMIDLYPYADLGEVPRDQFTKRKLNAAIVNPMDYLEYKINF